jgi:hypothetical protein
MQETDSETPFSLACAPNPNIEIVSGECSKILEQIVRD